MDNGGEKAGRRLEISFKDFLKAAKTVFKEKGYDPDLLNRQEVVNLIKATHAVYKDTIDTGVADNDIPAAMMRKLDHDAFMFFGFKVHHELSEVGLSLRDDKGQVKGYDAFAHDVRKIHDTYNGAYRLCRHIGADGRQMGRCGSRGRPVRFAVPYRRR